jgi:hypothetical protein
VPWALDQNQPSRDANLSFLQGGNPNLKPEKLNSYTIGAIITPRWLPGFSMSVDYYSIEVNKLIATVDAQQIADKYYDASSMASSYYSLVSRDPNIHLFEDMGVSRSDEFFKAEDARYCNQLFLQSPLFR